MAGCGFSARRSVLIYRAKSAQKNSAFNSIEDLRDVGALMPIARRREAQTERCTLNRQ
jgi:hypothetical protein